VSDTSQGPGWWVASDGRWYAPETHPNYVPPPTPPASGPPAAPLGSPAVPGPGWWMGSDGLMHPPLAGSPGAASGSEKKPRRGLIIALICVVVVLVAVVAGLALSKKKDAPSAAVATTVPSTSTTTVPSAATTAAAARAFGTAYNTLAAQVASDSTQLNTAEQTDGDPTAATAAINTQIAHLTAFDATMRSIEFPVAYQADARAVLSANAAFENGLSNLAANTDSISNYNATLVTVTPLKAAFVAAANTLASDLGLTPASG